MWSAISTILFCAFLIADGCIFRSLHMLSYDFAMLNSSLGSTAFGVEMKPFRQLSRDGIYR